MSPIPTLKEIRKQSPFKLNQIAEHMNVTRQTINLWENGDVPITVDNLQKLMVLYQADDILLSNAHTLIPQKGGR